MSGPWWFRFLWRRIDRTYGYGRRRRPDETSEEWRNVA